MKSARKRGFTLLETAIAIGCLTLVGSLCYYLLQAGTTLYAKAFSLNVSNLSLRYALDRMNVEISEATSTPELINLGSGNVILSNASSPAQGVRFDKYLGEHYVIVNPGGSAGVGLSAAFTFQVQISTNPLSSPPVPVVNDVLLINGISTRAVVRSCSIVSSSNQVETLSVTVGTPVTVAWLYPTVKAAVLVHEEAFIVQGQQLNFYQTMEGVSNVSNSSYITLTNNISSTGGSPFTTGSSASYVSVGLIVSSQQYSNYLAKKQSAGQYNNYLTVSTLLRPRNALEIASP
jgi:hypothetical protein